LHQESSLTAAACWLVNWCRRPTSTPQPQISEAERQQLEANLKAMGLEAPADENSDEDDDGAPPPPPPE
jgi:hypothetical protein